MWDIVSGGWGGWGGVGSPPSATPAPWSLDPLALVTVRLLPLTPECLGHITGLPSVYKTDQRASSKSMVSKCSGKKASLVINGASPVAQW